MSMDLKLLCAAASRLAMYEYEFSTFCVQLQAGKQCVSMNHWLKQVQRVSKMAHWVMQMPFKRVSNSVHHDAMIGGNDMNKSTQTKSKACRVRA